MNNKINSNLYLIKSLDRDNISQAKKEMFDDYVSRKTVTRNQSAEMLKIILESRNLSSV